MWQSLGLIYHVRASIYEKSEDFLKAKAVALVALEFCNNAMNLNYISIVEYRLGAIELYLGNIDEARKLWQKIIRQNFKGQELRLIAGTQLSLAELERDFGSEADALYWAQIAQEGFAEIGFKDLYKQAVTMIQNLLADHSRSAIKQLKLSSD